MKLLKENEILCADCGKIILANRLHYRAGNNGLKFCSKSCAYSAYENFYTKQQVNRTLIKVERSAAHASS